MLFLQKNPAGRYKILLFIAGIIAIIVVFYYSILVPQRMHIRQLTDALQAERRQVRKIEAFAGAHADIGLYQQETDAKLATVTRLLPDQPEISEFMLAVEQAAKAGGLELQQIKPEQFENKAGYRELPLEVTVQGTYFQTLDFLKRLEGLERFNSIVHMTVKSQSGNLTSKFRIMIYCYGTTQPATSGESQ